LKSPSTIHATASKGQYPQHSIVDRDERFARWFTSSLKPYFSLIDPSHVSTSKCSIIHLVQAAKRNFKRILHLDKLNQFGVLYYGSKVGVLTLHTPSDFGQTVLTLITMVCATWYTSQLILTRMYLTSYFVSHPSFRYFIISFTVFKTPLSAWT